ncbi:aplysianin-A-like [Mytilus trossulus]|uniref:aplysianin-A-like n=1 Tax=Mytilus trossulus TaxID=6551 RepID=UPI003007D6E0
MTVTYVPASDENCDDVAIVGGGIAGSYAAWRLRHTDQKITIYEYSNRIGGRLNTYHFPSAPDINVELGAMRFYPEVHKLLNKTICDVGLAQEIFELGGLAKSPNTLMYLRGNHLRFEEAGGPRTPYGLRPSKLKPPDQLKRELFNKYTNVQYFNDPASQKFNVKTVDGVYLNDQSVKAFYLKYGGQEVYNYLNDLNGFNSMQGSDTSATVALPTSPPTKPIVNTITGGMNQLPERLVDMFLQASKKHSLHLNKNLIAIKKRFDGKYDLFFQGTDTINGQTNIRKDNTLIRHCAKKVILGINRLGLKQLDWDVLYRPHIRKLLTDSTEDINKSKLFLVYDYPWWRRKDLNTNYIASDTPLRHTYDFGTSKYTHKSVLNAMYLDEDVDVWLELARRDNRNAGVNDYTFKPGNETICFAHKYLSEIYQIPLKHIPYPVDGIIVFWKNYPWGGDWNFWKPGYIWNEVEKQMIQPSKYDDIYIANNAFNSGTIPIWSQAALEIVECVLKRMKM